MSKNNLPLHIKKGIQNGLTNEEIAQRVGLDLDKYLNDRIERMRKVLKPL